MDAERAWEERLARAVGDAASASLAAALLALAAAAVSFVVYWAVRAGDPYLMPQLLGISAEATAAIWVLAIALMKVTALSFALTAFALWVWKRRLTRRLAAEPRP